MQETIAELDAYLTTHSLSSESVSAEEDALLATSAARVDEPQFKNGDSNHFCGLLAHCAGDGVLQ